MRRPAVDVGRRCWMMGSPGTAQDAVSAVPAATTGAIPLRSRARHSSGMPSTANEFMLGDTANPPGRFD